MSSKPPLDLFTPRGVAPRTPRHALSRAASPARSVRVARIALLARVLLPAPRLVRTGFQCRQQLLMNVVEATVGHHNDKVTATRLFGDGANNLGDLGDVARLHAGSLEIA